MTAILSHELLFGTAELPDDFDPTLPVNGAREVAAFLMDEPTNEDAFRRTVRGEVADRLNGITGDFADAVTDAVTAILFTIRERAREDASDVATWTTGVTWRFRGVTDEEAAAALSSIGERVGCQFRGTAFPVAAMATTIAGGILFAARAARPAVAVEAAA